MKVGDIVHVLVEGVCHGAGEIRKQGVNLSGGILGKDMPQVNVRMPRMRNPDAIPCEEYPEPKFVNSIFAERWCTVIGRAGFSLTAKEQEKLATWLEEHPELARGYQGASGGGLTYSFTPNSIGVTVGATLWKGTPAEISIDLTDYDSW